MFPSRAFHRFFEVPVTEYPEQRFLIEKKKYGRE